MAMSRSWWSPKKMSEMQLGGRTYKLHKVQKAQNQSNTAETETRMPQIMQMV